MIGVFGEIYVGRERYGMTDAEIFGNLDSKSLNNLDSFADRDFVDAGELEQELAEVIK